jgi:hypothetical protein
VRRSTAAKHGLYAAPLETLHGAAANVNEPVAIMNLLEVTQLREAAVRRRDHEAKTWQGIRSDFAGDLEADGRKLSPTDMLAAVPPHDDLIEAQALVDQLNGMINERGAWRMHGTSFVGARASVVSWRLHWHLCKMRVHYRGRHQYANSSKRLVEYVGAPKAGERLTSDTLAAIDTMARVLVNWGSMNHPTLHYEGRVYWEWSIPYTIDRIMIRPEQDEVILLTP